EEQDHRHRNPRYKQNYFTLQVKSDLYVLLMVERDVVDVVETLRFKKEMTNLPGPHRYRPPQKACGNRIEKHKDVAGQKTEGAEQVEALGDSALMVETVVVPALLLKLLPKGQVGSSFRGRVHGVLLSIVIWLWGTSTMDRRLEWSSSSTPHCRALKKQGETDKRLFAVAAWQDAPYFTE